MNIELTDPEERYLKVLLYSRVAKYHDLQMHAAAHGQEFFDSGEDLVMTLIEKLENEYDGCSGE